MKRIFELEPHEEQAFKEYLLGKIGSRELGEQIKMSNQGALNLVTKVCKQWFNEGKIKFVDKN